VPRSPLTSRRVLPGFAHVAAGLQPRFTSIPGGPGVRRLRWGTPAAERAIQLHDRRQLLLVEPGELELAFEQISLRVEHGQIAVKPAPLTRGATFAPRGAHRQIAVTPALIPLGR